MRITHAGLEQQEMLDRHVREMVRHHFDPDGGSPYWIQKARLLGLDPLAEVKGFEDLQRLGTLHEDDLRTVPADHLIPKSQLDYRQFAVHVYETGGSSGVPKRIMDTTHQEENARWVCSLLPHHGFQEKGNWLNLFPSGPHAVSLFTYTIARTRGELCYFIDIDPRWVKLCLKEERHEILNLYMDHVMHQAVNVLTTQDIAYLFTTPKLLERLIMHPEFDGEKIKGILCGGTQITREFHRVLKTEIIPHADFCALYGNTLMGVAPQLPAQFLDEDSPPWSIHYYGYFPNFIIDVVDEANPVQKVGYGQRGRVRITVLNHDVFIPGLLERDEGTRVPPCGEFPWDGIADVTIHSSASSSVVEGVY